MIVEWNFWKRVTQLASDMYLIFPIKNFNFIYIKNLKRSGKQTIIEHMVMDYDCELIDLMQLGDIL